MRILLCYSGHIMSTYDVAEGYEVALKALGHEVKVYNYHQTLAFYYRTIQYFRENFDSQFAGCDPYAFMEFASDRLVIVAVAFVPDVVLIVNGMNLHRNTYEMLHHLCLPVALILTESPYLDENQAVIMEKGHVTITFANDKSSIGPLTEASGVKTVYLPHSFDPKKHRPRPSLLKISPHYETDVFFHGTLWPDRVALLEPLLDLPYDVAISGVEPGHVVDESVLDDIVENSELAYWYNGTKIAINQHRTFVGINEDDSPCYYEGEVYSLGPRAFEIAACGAFQLSDNTRPELKEVFGDSVGIYTSGQNLLEQVVYFMEHGREREEMAREALARVQNCTFEKRAEEILIPNLQEVM